MLVESLTSLVPGAHGTSPAFGSNTVYDQQLVAIQSLHQQVQDANRARQDADARADRADRFHDNAVESLKKMTEEKEALQKQKMDKDQQAARDGLAHGAEEDRWP